MSIQLWTKVLAASPAQRLFFGTIFVNLVNISAINNKYRWPHVMPMILTKMSMRSDSFGAVLGKSLSSTFLRSFSFSKTHVGQFCTVS